MNEKATLSLDLYKVGVNWWLIVRKRIFCGKYLMSKIFLAYKLHMCTCGEIYERGLNCTLKALRPYWRTWNESARRSTCKISEMYICLWTLYYFFFLKKLFNLEIFRLRTVCIINIYIIILQLGNNMYY